MMLSAVTQIIVNFLLNTGIRCCVAGSKGLFFCYFGKLTKPPDDIGVIISFMGYKARSAVLDAFFGISEISSAASSQSIKGTIAEQAVKIVRIIGFMTGKILAFLMTEKAVSPFFLHYSKTFLLPWVHMPGYVFQKLTVGAGDGKPGRKQAFIAKGKKKGQNRRFFQAALNKQCLIL